jgi:hypothetical protein
LDLWELLALALFSIVVLGPSVQPWYFCWSLAVAGMLTLRPQLLVAIAGSCIGLVAMIRPNGQGLQMNPAVVPILLIALALARWALLPRTRSGRTIAATH